MKPEYHTVGMLQPLTIAPMGVTVQVLKIKPDTVRLCFFCPEGVTIDPPLPPACETVATGIASELRRQRRQKRLASRRKTG